MTKFFKLFSLLGHLPGDIIIEKEHFRFYFPWVTCLLLSLIVSGLIALIRYLNK